MSSELKKLTVEESGMDLGAMRTSVDAYPDCVGVAIYRNEALDSARCGEVAGAVFGPSNTIRSIEDLQNHKRYPFQISTQWAWLLRGYVAKEDIQSS